MTLNRREVLRAALMAGVAPAGLTSGAPVSRASPDASPVPGMPPDEDGYDLWLRYRPVTDAALLAHYRGAIGRVVLTTSGPIAPSIAGEFTRACSGMLGHAPATADAVTAAGSVLIGTPDTSPDSSPPPPINAPTRSTSGPPRMMLSSATRRSRTASGGTASPVSAGSIWRRLTSSWPGPGGHCKTRAHQMTHRERFGS